MSASSSDNRRRTNRVPVHLTGTLRFDVDDAPPQGASQVALPVLVRDVSPGGIALVLSERDMAREGQARLVNQLKLRRKMPVLLVMGVGEIRLKIHGQISWSTRTGGHTLPVTWIAGVDVAPADPRTRQILGNWSFIAQDALLEATEYARNHAWEEVAMMVRELGLDQLPRPVLVALLSQPLDS